MAIGPVDRATEGTGAIVERREALTHLGDGCGAGCGIGGRVSGTDWAALRVIVVVVVSLPAWEGVTAGTAVREEAAAEAEGAGGVPRGPKTPKNVLATKNGGGGTDPGPDHPQDTYQDPGHRPGAVCWTMDKTVIVTSSITVGVGVGVVVIVVIIIVIFVVVVAAAAAADAAVSRPTTNHAKVSQNQRPKTRARDTSPNTMVRFWCVTIPFFVSWEE